MSAAASFRLPAGTVTFLLTDVEGSTRHWEDEPEPMAEMSAQLECLLADAVQALHGVRPVEQGEGDSIVAAFSRPSDAVLAALAAQRAIQRATWATARPLRVRMAIHTGESRQREGGNYAGHAIIRTARLRAIAHGGQVLVSSSARDLALDQLGDEVAFVDLGVHRLKDLGRPEHVWQLTASDIPHEFPPLRSLDAHPNNLPIALSTFVGRTDEIRMLSEMLRHERLVTLSGSGGAGKTRLAQQVAAEVVDRLPDGAWWTDLVVTADDIVVPATVSRALGYTDDLQDPVEGLVRRIGTRTLLLVLDNCEHVIGGVSALVEALLRGCPNLTVLATSRIPLGVPGEVAWRVPPLALPQRAGRESLPSLSQYDSVLLFIDRAVRARQNFRLDESNAPAVAELCHRLDGVPLAIELAAARCKVLTPDRILAGLTDSIGLLTGGARTALPRQQTIEASIAWSHGLLGDAERLLFRRLAIFAGRFSLDAAEAVVPDEVLDRSLVLDLLEHLVDQSLVQLDETELGPRFRLLETVRQFALRELASGGGAGLLSDRHDAWYVARGAALWPVFVPHMADLLDIVDDERADLTSALDRTLTLDRLDDVAPFAKGYLTALGVRHNAEADRLYQRVVAALSHRPSSDLGHLLVRWSEVLFYRGDSERGAQLLEEASNLAVELDDRELAAHIAVMELLGEAWESPRTVVARIADVERQCRDAGDTHDADSCIGSAAYLYFFVGDRSSMEAAFARAEREIGDECPRCRAYRALMFAETELSLGRPASALHHAQLGRVANARLAEPTTATWIQSTFAAIALFEGRDPAQLEDAAATWRRAVEQNDGFALGVAAEGHALVTRFEEPNLAAAELRLMLPLMGVSHSRASVLLHLASVLQGMNQLDDAADHLREGRTIIEQLGNSRLASSCSRREAWIALATRRVGEADDLGHQALSAALHGPWPVEVLETIELLATSAAAQGSWVESARLFGAADRTREEIGYRQLLEPDATAVVSARAAVEAALGNAFADGLAAGHALDMPEAVAYAQRARGERKRPTFGWESLTPTETEVAQLATAGLTNPQIAERLLMGRETVKTHLSSVYLKTGLRNRSQLAAELTRRRIDH